MEMCRFADRDNLDYQLVSGVIRRWARLALEQAVSRISAIDQGATSSSVVGNAVGIEATHLPVSLRH